MNGTDLLAEFRKSRTEAAFSGLVRRYTNLVYSIAKRRVNNASMAEEAAQTVFIKLAKAVPDVHSDAELVAWLHRTTVHASIDLWRSETRRSAREEQAAVMQPDPAQDSSWSEIAPIVDEALNELNDAERMAILLRFFDRKSMREIGLAFDISEDAAKMRVSRAMEQLRAACGKRGVVCATVVLASFLTKRAVEAAPAALVLALAALQIPASANATAGMASLVARSSIIKLAGSLAVVAGASAVLWLASPHASRSFREYEDGRASNVSPATNQSPAAPTANEGALGEATPVNPVQLLKNVARARSRIRSGEMAFEITTDRPLRDRRREPRVIRAVALFDGSNRQFECFAREYSYSIEANDDPTIKERAEQMSSEQAVQAGLVTPFESHHVAAYDGSRLMDYWEINSSQNTTTIADPAKGSAVFVFDPRCLGLSATLLPTETITSCVGNADAAQMVGEEAVAGISTWHVRSRQLSQNHDFWIEKAHPDRVMKYACNGWTAVSEYNDADPNDPLPVKITVHLPIQTQSGQTAFLEQQIVRGQSQFNIGVDPISWTLAGLKMKIGTAVQDDRLMRRIGYWNGTGLSEFPPNETAQPPIAPDRVKLLTQLETEPFLPQALGAAQWIISNTPDGPEVDEAASVITNYHSTDTNLVPLCRELERLRPQCSSSVLEALLDNNPSPAVRGSACYVLATLSKDQAKFGADKKATAEAEKFFKRAITEFGQEKWNGSALADLAKPELDELRHLSIGTRAPETEGRDLDGQPLKLSDYRGKVVALVFWTEWNGCRPEMPVLLKLLEQLKGQPFSIVGVYCGDDPDRGKETANKLGMAWPSFQDSPNGPISTLWGNKGWPSYDLIDARGIIRSRQVTADLPGAIEALMKQ